MNWIEFSKMNEAIEHISPTRKAAHLGQEWNNISSKVDTVKILAMELPPNNLREKKAMKWVTEVYGIFDDELEGEVYTHGDIGEAVYNLDDNDNDSGYGMATVISLLSMNCSKSDGESFRQFRTAFLNMSSLEKKWFLRFWLRKPRNGIRTGTVIRKVLAGAYNEKESSIKKYTQMHTLSDIVAYLERGETPPNDMLIGRYVRPMLAKAIPKEKWPVKRIIEYKYDGARYQIHKNESEIIIFNRKGLPVTSKFPEVAESMLKWENLPSQYIIDTEIYPVNMDGSPAPFKNMGTRIHSKDIEAAIEKCPVKLAVFDCMLYGVENLVDVKLESRLEYIKKFPEQAVRVEDNEDVLYTKAINEGFEGIMVKDLNAVYESGKRSKAWAKHKPPRFDIDVVVVGARYGEGKRSNVYGSYDIAVKDENEFVSVGSVGTGFKDVDLLKLTAQGRKIVQSIDNGTYKLLPRIVLEVTCDLITQDVNGNLGLRFPRLIRIRDDKPVSEINTLRDLEEMR